MNSRCFFVTITLLLFLNVGVSIWLLRDLAVFGPVGFVFVEGALVMELVAALAAVVPLVGEVGDADFVRVRNCRVNFDLQKQISN